MSLSTISVSRSTLTVPLTGGGYSPGATPDRHYQTARSNPPSPPTDRYSKEEPLRKPATDNPWQAFPIRIARRLGK